jgi:ketosteroid isomerase-like protein
MRVQRASISKPPKLNIMGPKFRISLLIAMLISSISWSQSKNNDKSEKVLLKMVHDHLDALQKGDTSWIKYNFNDQYTYTSPVGMVINKTAAINMLGSGAIKLESGTTEDLVVYVYGDAGIVTELSIIKGSIGNMDISGKYRYLYVFSKQSGRWQIVAEQGTSVRQ